MFRISSQIKYKDLATYKKLKNEFKPNKKRRQNIDKDIKHHIGKDIVLGDKAENLMKRDSYKRVNGKMRQVGWS